MFSKIHSNTCHYNKLKSKKRIQVALPRMLITWIQGVRSIKKRRVLLGFVTRESLQQLTGGHHHTATENT